MLSRLDQMLDDISLENNRIDDERFEREVQKIDDTIKSFCGELPDVDIRYPREKPKRWEVEKASEMIIHGQFKSTRVLSRPDKNTERPLTEDEMKRRLKIFAKKHGIKVIKMSEYKKQQEAKMREDVANAVPAIKKNLIERIKDDENTIETNKEMPVKGIVSKKTIEKEKSATLDSFSKEVGGKPKTKEITKKKSLGLHRQNANGRGGRE